MRRLANLALAALLLAAPLSGCTQAIDDLTDRFTGRHEEPGQRAEEYIRGDEYSKLLIEVDYVPGSEPHPEALEQLKSAARDHLDKDEVRVRTQGEVEGKGENYEYSLRDEIVPMEDRYRDNYSGGDTAVLYFIYLDGGSDRDQDDRQVLGSAYFGSSLVMFKGNIRESSCTDCGLASTQPEIRFVERAVIVHELGHNLGLVNNGIPMQQDHEDPEHPRHSDNQDSVMYWAVETSRITNVFSGGSDIPYQFDQNDKRDIRAVREGGS